MALTVVAFAPELLRASVSEISFWASVSEISFWASVSEISRKWRSYFLPCAAVTGIWNEGTESTCDRIKRSSHHHCGYYHQWLLMYFAIPSPNRNQNKLLGESCYCSLGTMANIHPHPPRNKLVSLQTIVIVWIQLTPDKSIEIISILKPTL